MFRIFVFCATVFFISACADTAQVAVGPSAEEIKQQKKADHRLFHATLRKHVKAVGDRDLETLRTMMSPDGQMHLIRPNTEVVYSTDKYLQYHESWFQDTSWTIKSTITDSEVGHDLGLAITEVLYEVPDRGGKPYWNKMTISYVLKKMEGAWYVISDHSGSVNKSTD